MKLWKYSGIYLWATGIIHLAVGLVMGNSSYMAMLGDGLVNSVGSDNRCRQAGAK